MKKFAIRSALATIVVAIFALFSVAPAQAVGPATLAFASTPGSFNAGGSSPAMVLDFTPGSVSSYNRIKIGIFDSTGSTYEATSAVNLTSPPNGCHLTLDSSIVGCTGMSQGGFIELSNSFSGAAHLDFTSGLFTLPTSPGNYTIKAEMYSGGTAVAGQSATVAITVGAASYAITFTAGGGSGTQSSFTTTGTFTLPATTTFTPPSGKVFGGWVDSAVSNTVLTSGASYSVSQDTTLMPVWVSSGNNNNQSSPVAFSPVSFSIPVAPGQRIVGENVAITATNLALSTDYSVVLRSTPQILAQGRTVSSSFNTSVTIPNNLEPGWHSITFSATRSDGAALEEKVYFKINADGTLLATSTDTPAELAFTGAITAGAIPLSIIVLLMGFVAFFVAREINPDFMRVMTLTRNAHGELDFVKRRIRSEDF